MTVAFARAVASAFRAHGIAATVDPDGVARAVRLLPQLADRTGMFRETPLIEAGGVFEIQTADWSGFAPGAVLLIGAERRTVKRTEVRDPRRLKVVLFTVPE